jgi:hypothetical protein
VDVLVYGREPVGGSFELIDHWHPPAQTPMSVETKREDSHEPVC